MTVTPGATVPLRQKLARKTNKANSIFEMVLLDLQLTVAPPMTAANLTQTLLEAMGTAELASAVLGIAVESDPVIENGKPLGGLIPPAATPAATPCDCAWALEVGACDASELEVLAAPAPGDSPECETEGCVGKGACLLREADESFTCEVCRRPPAPHVGRRLTMSPRLAIFAGGPRLLHQR